MWTLTVEVGEVSQQYWIDCHVFMGKLQTGWKTLVSQSLQLKCESANCVTQEKISLMLSKSWLPRVETWLYVEPVFYASSLQTYYKVLLWLITGLKTHKIPLVNISYYQGTRLTWTKLTTWENSLKRTWSVRSQNGAGIWKYM